MNYTFLKIFITSSHGAADTMDAYLLSDSCLVPAEISVSHCWCQEGLLIKNCSSASE